jgi:hypothetical protein
VENEERKMTSDEALKKIANALFPKPRKDKGGLMVDGDAYYNLEGARIDLERTGADRVCLETIESVQQQIIAVSKVLQKAGVR